MKKIILIYIWVFFNSLLPQQLQENKYGLLVVDNVDLYAELVSVDSSKLLIDLEDFIPGIIPDIRYATDNNFYGSPVYSDEKIFLRTKAAEALWLVQKELLKQNKSLKVFDAYRPYSVTVLFYHKIKDTNFVASAYTGSRHNRGCAIDLTIVDLASGKDLKMPTEYDDFSERAAADFMDITEEEKANRDLLQSLMIKNGFVALRSEWWHFDFSDWKKYEITDISFSDLEKIYLEYKEKHFYDR